MASQETSSRAWWQVAMVRSGMSSLLQCSCPFSLWRELSPTWVKGQPLLGLSGSLDLSLSFQLPSVRTTQGSCDPQSTCWARWGRGCRSSNNLEALGEAAATLLGTPLAPCPRQEKSMPASWHSYGPYYPQGWVSAFCRILETTDTSLVDTFLFHHLLIDYQFVVCWLWVELFRGGRLCLQKRLCFQMILSLNSNLASPWSPNQSSSSVKEAFTVLFPKVWKDEMRI